GIEYDILLRYIERFWQEPSEIVQHRDPVGGKTIGYKHVFDIRRNRDEALELLLHHAVFRTYSRGFESRRIRAIRFAPRPQLFRANRPIWESFQLIAAKVFIIVDGTDGWNNRPNFL